MTITDAQLRRYLVATGWHEHPDHPGLWERGNLAVATAPHVEVCEALAALCEADGRPVRDVIREVRTCSTEVGCG